MTGFKKILIGFVYSIFLMVLALGFSSISDAKSGGGDGHGDGHVEKKHAAPHWGYSGADGPTHWGDLSADFSACKNGKKQSPIDITGVSPENLSAIDFNYKSSKLSILNNGHTIQANYDSGSTIEVDGKKFDLLQFHFHGPSEHTVDGEHALMEMHLVHKAADGALAVVGVMIEEGKHNSSFDNAWHNLPAHSGDHKDVGVLMKAAELLPKSKGYTTYSGSLTTPPCTEGVTWLVLNESIHLSKKQIEAFAHIVEHNNRPVQPVNKRSIKSAK
ncbi:MAG: carbonic anhydrase family protein [Proteobacteria bacterium]|nr:carbonic anhydrase family protein [Pseudomonadota bacterium]